MACTDCSAPTWVVQRVSVEKCVGWNFGVFQQYRRGADLRCVCIMAPLDLKKLPLRGVPQTFRLIASMRLRQALYYVGYGAAMARDRR